MSWGKKTLSWVFLPKGAVSNAVPVPRASWRPNNDQKCAGNADEFKETLEAYIPKTMNDLEAKMAERIDAIEKFLDFLQKAKPGENENWLEMMRILDAEVEKLKAQPKADGVFGQAILDKAKKMDKDQHGKTWDGALKQVQKRTVVWRAVCDFDDYYNDTYGSAKK